MSYHPRTTDTNRIAFEIQAGSDLLDQIEMSMSLYPDFELNVDNCHQEPIHRPLAIQGLGHLCVFDANHDYRLHAASNELATLFGLPWSKMWDRPTVEWLPSLLWDALTTPHAVDPMVAPWLFQPDPGQNGCDDFDVIAHQLGSKTYIELEQHDSSSDSYLTLHQIAESFRACCSSHQLFQTTAERLRGLLGYDRVMIYQFDTDFHGCVVGEAKSVSLDSFLGLHYPATDIPATARELFLTNRSRIIADIQSSNQSLVFPPGFDIYASANYLDLSMCQLRATSPIHIEYLLNMGVRASFTIAIIRGGKLWGLVACHHYSARTLPFRLRKTGEMLADLFAYRLSDLELCAQDERRQVSQQAENSFLDQIQIEDYYKLEMAENGAVLREICMSDGAAVVTLQGVSCSVGIVPEPNQMLAIRDWLLTRESRDVFATDDMLTDLPIACQPLGFAGGMLAARVSEISKSYLLWFRLPQRQTTTWAGDPSKTLITVPIEESDQVRLSPRQSFAKWLQAVDNKSLPWTADAFAMVERVRDKILKKEFNRTATIVLRNRQEFMQLIYAASHDLQEPLRTQLNYLELLDEEIQVAGHAEWQRFVKRAAHAVHRMQALISDLLDYASLGVESPRQLINLNEIIDEIRVDLAQAVSKKQALIEVEKLPLFRGSRNELKQLFQNLLSNSIKYVAPDVEPRVRIYPTLQGNFVSLSVEDNGIGIAAEHFEKIFLMFQRLHSREQYEGTGIGLALCKKIVESYDGKIRVESRVAHGSTFTMQFHTSFFQNS